LVAKTSAKVDLLVLVNFLTLFIRFRKKRKNETLNVSEDPAVVCKLFLSF